MSKKYKVKHEEKNDINEEEITNNSNNLSKKELYDLQKQEKLKLREKASKKSKKNKSSKKTYKTNLAGRIFAIAMLILMIGSVIATISYYFR